VEQDSIHVWRASLDQLTEKVRALSSTLSSHELERARRYRSERDRSDFVVGRGFLRRLLGLYLRVPPREIGFAYGRRGKPSLAAGFDRRLRFNLSHSGQVLLCAMAWQREVGVDVEQVRSIPDCEAVAASVFSRSEFAELRSLHGRQKEQAFYRCWTRKEAYIKADGDGFTLPVRQIEVTLDPGGPAKLVRGAGLAGEHGGWRLYDLSPALGYVGAVAVDGPIDQLNCWRFDSDTKRAIGSRRAVGAR
jgi:4'-phosphopantetheinyl transferase